MKNLIARLATGGRSLLVFTIVLHAAALSADSDAHRVPAASAFAVPPAPTGLTAVAGNARVTLSWAAAPTATSYRVYRTTNGTFSNTALTTITTTTYTNTGLVNGTAYSYRVTARNTSGESVPSTVVTATPVPPPPAPLSVTAVGGDRQVNVSWSAVTGATAYKLYRSLTSGSFSSTATATIAAGTTSYADTGLENGPLYFYSIIATNASGDSARSPQASAYTEAPRPVYDAQTVAAFRLLRAATWGPRLADAEHVRAVGGNAFIDEQFAQPVSVYPDSLYAGPPDYVQQQFFTLALTGPDQLRQRVAWALHKIWVVSAVDAGAGQGLVTYQRVLLDNAFGNYRTLMKAVTLTPSMGRYLTMVNNRSQSVTGLPPNENYARELMQLFVLGLFRLNPDGTPVMAGGAPVPTYTQDDVRALARILTGWTFGDGNPATIPTGLAAANDRVPLEAVNKYHDTGAKTFLGQSFAAGATAEADLDHALDVMFAHPNVGPFVASQLIKQLVTSNPSTDYVRDIAAVFDNNGQGVRGDLAAVVRAILMHPQAYVAGDGKLTEPALFATSILRSLGATSNNLTVVVDRVSEMGQKVLYPPSVFSYFAPSFTLPSAGAGSPLIGGPEFQILTTATAVERANFVADVLSGLSATLTLDTTPYTSRARDAAALVDYCDLTLLGGRLTSQARSEMIAAVRKISISSVAERANTALYLTFVMAQWQVDR